MQRPTCKKSNIHGCGRQQKAGAITKKQTCISKAITERFHALCLVFLCNYLTCRNTSQTRSPHPSSGPGNVSCKKKTGVQGVALCKMQLRPANSHLDERRARAHRPVDSHAQGAFSLRWKSSLTPTSTGADHQLHAQAVTMQD